MVRSETEADTDAVRDGTGGRSTGGVKAPLPNAPRAYSSADVGSGRESEELEVGASPRSAVGIQRQNAVQDILDLDTTRSSTRRTSTL
jgi:hypothetical protein